MLNGSDNCNGEGFGTVCDAAPDIDYVVNSQGMGLLRAEFFGAPGAGNWNPDADFSSDGVVNSLDPGTMKQRFVLFPGPSGLPTACD